MPVASGAAQVISSLIGAAGQAAPTVAAAINQRKAERQATRDGRAAEAQIITTTGVPVQPQTGWPGWLKLTLGVVGGVAVIGGVAYVARSFGGTKRTKRSRRR